MVAAASLWALPALAQAPSPSSGDSDHRAPAASSPARGTHCSQSQQEAVDQAKAGAIARLGRSIYYSAHVPEAMRSTVAEPQYQRMVYNKAVQLFGDPHFDMERGVATLRGMKTQLQRTDSDPMLVCAARGDRHCRNRDAYVVDASPPIHLCPGFFLYEPGVTPAPNLSDKQVRTVVHEAAHLYGIGDPGDEEYCIMFDCITNCGAPDTTADSWSHFVHCIVGLPPDRGDSGAPSR